MGGALRQGFIAAGAMSGGLQSSDSPHGCRAFRQMFGEWPRRLHFVGKMPMGVVCEAGSWRSAGVAGRVEIEEAETSRVEIVEAETSRV